MDRNREARRGTVAAVNGVGHSRRGHRNGSYRDSPEEDTGIAMGEMGRLRDRGSKKDRDRDCDRSGRSKRRRGERILHASNREEGDGSSSESVEDEEEDASVAVRLPVSPALNPGALSSMPHNHHRKSFPMTAKVARSPAVLKAADEMIGVPVPRRARSSSAKRAQEFSGSGAEPILRQASNSPASPSPLSAASISPPSSSASIRKKMKLISGTKHRQPKLSKSASVPEDLEIEVAEVLFGLTRQFQSSPPKPETQKLDAKGTYGSGNEAKSRVSSPISISPQPAVPLPSSLPPPIMSTYAAPMPAPVPKRKRPRPFVNLEDESPTILARVPAPPGSSVSSGAKMLLVPPAKSEASSPRSENNEASPAVENGSGNQCDLGVSHVAMPPIDVQQDSVKLDNKMAPDLKLSTGESDGQDRTETSEANELLQNDLDANLDGTAETKAIPAAESSREVKFSIDLMAPPGKSSPEREGLLDNAANHKAPIAVTEMVPKVETAKVEEEKVEKTAKLEEVRIAVEAVKVENPMREDFYMKKQIVKERTLDLQLDFDKPYKDGLRCSKQQFQKQQPRSVKIEPKQERAAQPALPLQMPVAGWPGGFPPFGYMGQFSSLQPALPMDGSSRSSKPVQPTKFASSQLRPKRCATHCYIAHNIHYHQQLSRMNPFWPAAAGAAPLYGGKQYNLNVVPPLESSIVRNPLQGSFPVSNMGSMQDNGGLLAASSTGHSSKDKNSADNTFIEAAQRKQLVLKQTPLPGMATNMLHGAFIFPINQQQAAAKSGVSKPTPGAGNAALSSTSASSAVAGSGMGGPATTMSFNYPGLPPNEAMYMAILPNGACPFPIPSHVGAATPYRGSPVQAMPFFNGSLYSSQMLSSQQLQQQQPPHQQPSHSHAQQGHQNTSTSSGSSSSQKPSQQSQQAPGSGAAGTVGSSHSLAASKQQRQQLPTQCETGREDNPSTADSRVSQAQKSIYGNNLAMAIHPQNLAMFSPAAAAALGSGGGSHNEKPQPPSQHQSMKVELTTSQAFAMSFAPFGGVAAAAAPLPGHDFSSMVQNHAFFQGLPEAARHGYYFSAAAAGFNPVTQHKKPPRQTPEDGKSTRVSMTSSMTGEVEKKIMATSKAPESVCQQSLNFSQADSDLPIPTILGNGSSSQTLNLIQAPANVGLVSSRPSNVASPTSGAATATNSQLIQQQQLQHQQHQLIQLQKHQQQLQLQHQLVNRTKLSTPVTNATVYSDRLPAGSNMAKFPQALAGFPQTLIQGSSTTQPPQWKTCARAATPASAASTATSTTKNQLPRQQGSSMQQPLLTPSHQTQISFGLNSSKAAAPTGQQHLAGGSSNPTLSSAASIVVGSPQNSVSKSTGGSPRSSSGAKAGPSQATALPLQQQQQQQPAKNSPSSSTLKSSPLSNSSSPSILGHPHLPSASNESIKQQQQSQSQQQLQKQQPFPQAQFFFSNPYMNAQTSQSHGAAVAAYYHQRRQSEPPPQQQQQDHQNSTPGSSSILSMCPSPGAPTTSDPAKAAAASNMKGVTAPGLLQHHAQFAAMAQSAFPYMHPMPSVKPAEQKPAAGTNSNSIHLSPFGQSCENISSGVCGVTSFMKYNGLFPRK